MDLTDEAIADFAEHLVPEAFATASSATRVDILPLAERTWLSDFVQRCQEDAVAARHVSGEGPGAVIFVQRRDERWRWDLPMAFCPLEVLAERVREEVACFPNPLVFVCSLWERERYRLRGGAELTTLTWDMPWYVEIRRRPGAGIFTGVTQVQGATVGTTRALPSKTAFEREARGVLLRHPARRKYRLG